MYEELDGPAVSALRRAIVKIFIFMKSNFKWEYLPDLLPRGRASLDHRNIHEGVVIIDDGNLPRAV
jgi:hypothetical protein